MYNQRALLSAAAMLWLAVAQHGLAQSTGTIHGRVQDISGAVVPEVLVTATQQGTNLTREIPTDAGGLYVVTELPVGTWDVKFTKAGFATYLQRGVLLQVNTNVEVNGTLGIAQSATTVTVNAEANLVQTTST